MPKLVGYARISTKDQSLNPQITELLNSGCKKSLIFTDVISGAKSDRPGLEKCLSSLQEYDTLIVCRLDRLGRSLSHLVNLIEYLKNRKVAFKSIEDGMIDTTTASGELIFNIFSSIAQFERSLIQERTKARLEATRARGRLGGRKPIYNNHPKVIAAKKMHLDQSLSIKDICKTLNISRASFYRYLSL
jgi:DNA invertase Pin-like site-specific DNA recombinase